MAGAGTRLRRLVAALALFAAIAPAAWAGEPDMTAVNAMDWARFIEKFGGIFEKSPWVAERAWDSRPFASLDAMHAAMVTVVKYASLPGDLCADELPRLD